MCPCLYCNLKHVHVIQKICGLLKCAVNNYKTTFQNFRKSVFRFVDCNECLFFKNKTVNTNTAKLGEGFKRASVLPKAGGQ